MSAEMTVTKSHFRDAGEQDEEGLFDYFYSGNLYEFDYGSVIYTVRQYDEAPERVSFMNWHEQRRHQYNRFKTIPYEDGRFIQAVRYLRDKERVAEVAVLTNRGYESVLLDKLPASEV